MRHILLSTALCALPLALACKDKGGTDSGATDGTTDTDGGTDSGDAAFAPDFHCPGGAGCEDADGPLSVGAAALTITPTCYESWEDLDGNAEYDDDTEVFFDCGCDRLCKGDDGYPGPDDGEGDGDFQALWLAGYQNNRPAAGVQDDLWARTIVFDQGSTRIALVSLDVVGYFRTDVQSIRDLVAAAGVDVDHVIVSSTHGHEGPDTMGLWGPRETVSGVNPDWIANINERAAQSVVDAVADLREVGTFKVGSSDIRTYSDKGAFNVITDLRDPIVIDESMGGAGFWDASGQPIAMLAHFGDHPESVADENNLITSDFAHGLRQAVEEGTHWDAYDKEGLGGTAIFINGAVGGMMTGLRVEVEDPDGNKWRDYTHERTLRMGWLLGEMAIDAIDGGEEATTMDLKLATTTFKLPVDNWGFQVLFLTGIVDRELFDYDPEQLIDDDNVPWIVTEANILQVGPLRFYTVPGELFPELNIGGYDGSHKGHDDADLIDPENPNPPDLAAAPAGPYLRERVGGAHAWVVGLGNDQLGYIVPPYDFELDPVSPWFDEAEGDHYEETNSLSASAAPLIEEHLDTLIGWCQENQGL